MSSFNAYLYARGVAERFLPDEYRLENNQLVVPTTFILSRMPSGAVLSTYADHVWDFSPYLPNCDCKLNFTSWLKYARTNDFLLVKFVQK
jgi:hypothetical protein